MYNTNMDMNTAYLFNDGEYISFTHNNRTIRFRGPYSLVCFDHVKLWDNGYIEVMAKYAHEENLIEEYIDLIPILKNLYIDSESFLKGIERVEVCDVRTRN